MESAIEESDNALEQSLKEVQLQPKIDITNLEPDTADSLEDTASEELMKAQLQPKIDINTLKNEILTVGMQVSATYIAS